MIFITTLFISLAAIFKALADLEEESGGKKASSNNKNKYKNPFIRLLFRTILVGFTDKWHRYNLIQYTCIQIVLTMWIDSPLHWLVTFLIIKTLFSGMNELTRQIKTRIKQGNGKRSV